MTDYDQMKLHWLNERYVFVEPRHGVCGNSGEIEYRGFASTRGTRPFNAEDLARCVSALANVERGLAGFGVTETGYASDNNVVRLGELIGWWIIGLEHPKRRH